MGSSLFGAKPRQTPQTNSGAGANSGTHPVIAAYQEALRRGDPRAQMAAQLLSGGNPQQLKTTALNMLRERGLSPEAVIRQLGIK